MTHNINMRSNYIQNILKEYPQQLKNYILSRSWEDTIDKKCAGLSEEQVSIVKDNFLGIVLGVREEQDVAIDIQGRITDTNKINLIFSTYRILADEIEKVLKSNQQPNLTTKNFVPTQNTLKEQEKPLDAEIMSHFSKPKEEQTPVTPKPEGDTDTKTQYAYNPYSIPRFGSVMPKSHQNVAQNVGTDLTEIKKPEEIEEVIPNIKPAPAPHPESSVKIPTPEEKEVPVVDEANKKSVESYGENDPYREPIR